MRFPALGLAVLFAVGATDGAHAEDGGPVFAKPDLSPAGVRALAATCASCHGTNGQSAGGAISGLAGTSKDLFVDQMRLFKSGKREATLMPQIVRGLTDAEIAALGDFFAAQVK